VKKNSDTISTLPLSVISVLLSVDVMMSFCFVELYCNLIRYLNESISGLLLGLDDCLCHTGSDENEIVNCEG
jgi:hypothetical protein